MGWSAPGPVALARLFLRTPRRGRGPVVGRQVRGLLTERILAVRGRAGADQREQSHRYEYH